MTPSDARLEAITTVTRRARVTGFFFDFDGTLAPIQDDPDTVRPVSGATDALSDLARLIGRVGIVSARPVAFLQRHFADPAIVLSGLYGLQRSSRDAGTIVDPAAQQWVPAVREITERAAAELPARIRIEDKSLSVALHYRSAPALEPVVTGWADARAHEYALRAQRGRMVVELLPALEFDKGTVIRREIADLESAWYFGDDIGDIPAYRALAERAAVDRGFTAFRLAVANPETGGGLDGLVDLVLPDQMAVVALVNEVTVALRHSYSTEDRPAN